MVLRLASISVFASLLLLSSHNGWAQKPVLVMQTEHTSYVWSVVFSPDSRLLASASDAGVDDGTIKLWEVATGRELRTLAGHGHSILHIAFGPEGKTIASTDGRFVRLWDTATGHEILTLQGGAWFWSVAFSPDGKTLAGANTDGTIQLWEVESGKELRTLKAHPGGVTSVTFSPDGKTLASGGRDNSVKLWDMASPKESRILKGHTSWVLSVSFGRDGKSLASGSSDGTVRLWNLESGSSRIILSTKGAIVAIGLRPDGKTLASSDGKAVKLISVETGQEQQRLPDLTKNVKTVAFSSDNSLFAYGGVDGSIRLWNLKTNQELFTFRKYASPATTIVLSADARKLAVGTEDNAIKLWDVSGEGRMLTLSAPTDHYIQSITFSRDGKLLASGSFRTVRLWNAETGQEINEVFQVAGQVNSVAFSADGQRLAAADSASVTIGDGIIEDNTINIWDVATGRMIRSLKSDAPTSKFIQIAFSGHDEDLMASVEDSNLVVLLNGKFGYQRTVKLWNIATGKVVELASYSWRYVDGKPKNEINQNDGILNNILSNVPELKPGNVSTAMSGGLKVEARENGIINLSRWRGGALACSLIAIDENDWLVVTPDGLFDGSPPAWNKIIWRFNNNTFDYAPVEGYFYDFFYPGLLAEILAGKYPLAPDISQKDRRQPELKVMLAREVGGNPTVNEGGRTVAIKIDVTELAADKKHKVGSGAQDVRLFRNGSLVKVWRGDVLRGQTSVTLEATIPIVAGENKLTAYAFNHDDIKSSDATLIVTGADSLKRPGTAHILAVGINRYSNTQYDLKYAVADADDFSAEVKRQQELLKRYAQVEVISLSDTEATKANITQKLAQLATRVQPEDAVIVYFAGHGTAHGNQFYLIPHDLGYDGARENLNEAGLQTILAHSISDRELEKLFEGIDAGQLLLVIDACNSGQALEAEEKRRGPMNSKGLAQLAYEKGMYVLTAAQSYQAAQEAAKFGHGFLTYALVEEGLKRGAADREPKDRAINLREWLNYATEQVPKMQEENMLDALRGRSRYLNFVGDGSGPKDTKNNIQRPRVFYRRELDSNPLVVAVVGATAPQ